MQEIERRRFLRLAGAGALAAAGTGLLAACGGGGTEAGATATTVAGATKKSGNRKVRLGFIALTDCASIVMAKELGYFAERDLDVSVEKQASWPATRDALLTGGIDGAHCLFGMPFAVASGLGGGAPSQALKIAMMINNNGQAITLSKDFAAVGYGDLDKAGAALESKSPTLAMTFPGGTHDIWLRYWLRATGADESAIKIIPIPPPQMVANMNVGTMDGFCVGEPWGAVAAQQGIGFTHITSQDIWKHHPEKALVVNERFATERADVLKDVMGAVLKASKWLDDLDNRARTADVIGAAAYVNAPAVEILGRLKGEYELGAGIPDKTYTDDYMVFHRDGEVNAPRRAHALWWLAQFQRLGLQATAPITTALPEALILQDLYEEVAAAEGVDVPDDDMAPFDVALDGATFDPTKPDEEAKRP
jgi:nitrate/nitrite transport system substrate-binding protein